MISLASAPVFKAGNQAAVFENLPQPVTDVLQNVKQFNDSIQKPLQNTPFLQKTSEIVNAPDSVVISWLQSIAIFFKKAVSVVGNVFKTILKPIGRFFALIFDWLAKLIRIGIN